MSLSVKVAWIGRKELQRDLAVAAARIPTEMERNTGTAAQVVVAAAQREIQGERTRATFIPKGGKRVRRKPPKPITARPRRLGNFEGHIRNTMSATVERTGKRVNAEVGPLAVYAKLQELGGSVSVPSWGYGKRHHQKHPARIPARPFLGPAIKKTQEQVFRLIGRTFKVIR